MKKNNDVDNVDNDDLINNSDNNSNNSDNSDNSDDNNFVDNSKNKDDNITNEFKEKVITYIKIDDLIRDKMEEIKELRNNKKVCEEFIIKFLEDKNAPFVKIKDGKLTKSKTELKGSLKPEVIKDAIMEGIKGKELTADEIKSHDITANIMNIMENKRSKTVRTTLRRIFSDSKSKSKSKAKAKAKSNN